MTSPRPRPILTPSPYDTSTVGVPWSPSFTGPRTTTRVVGASAAASANATVSDWDRYIATIKQAMAEAAGWEREKKRLELEDAIKGRENAMAIAQLQAETSRYGTDVQAQTSMAQLLENARQFDANHGLDVIKTGVEYLSTPDRAFMYGDFQDAMSRAGEGLGPRPYGATGTPHMKTWEDFAALSGFDSLPAVQNGQSAQMTASQGGGGAGSPGQGSDLRVKAAMGILKAIPPSDGMGHDDDDFAALNAIQNVFSASKPGSYERLRPGQQKMFAAGLSRLGYYAPDALKQMRRNAPGQQSSALA